MLTLSISDACNGTEENGHFPHVSGLTFSVNTVGDEHKRVYNVKIMNAETGNYEALVLDRMYTVASNNFILLECGDGMTMFKGAKVIRDTGILDVEIFEEYIVENLGGVIDETYAEADGRITFTEGEVTLQPDVTDEEHGDHTIWIAGISGVLAVAAVAVILTRRRKRM